MFNVILIKVEVLHMQLVSYSGKRSGVSPGGGGGVVYMQWALSF